ncbi:hypothetical protein B296_00057071 [Ensete ventricosum]|uniref:Uncharacterized protein n=1 Tax=Ensete ventricosum TaxID=4639 RepID=A0A426WYT4_ENSVE|nr:hypothetical protein B296_00057071 [Ensete ventricosum]
MPCSLPLCGRRATPPLQATAPVGDHPLWVGLGHGLAVGGRPCMGAGRGWSSILLAAFAAKMQQEYVEQFYVIQSHHTQFKTNLSHENLGFDTTVEKPQRIRMEKMKDVKRPPL